MANNSAGLDQQLYPDQAAHSEVYGTAMTIIKQQMQHFQCAFGKALKQTLSILRIIVYAQLQH